MRYFKIAWVEDIELQQSHVNLQLLNERVFEKWVGGEWSNNHIHNQKQADFLGRKFHIVRNDLSESPRSESNSSYPGPYKKKEQGFSSEDSPDNLAVNCLQTVPRPRNYSI
jgi:hypothetical protein